MASFPGRSQSVYYEHYGVKNGLGQSQVSAMVQDAHGFVWIGTHGGGLTRFDGRRFRDFRIEDGLLSNDIYDILLSDNKLIIATIRGISSFDLSTYEFQTLYESGEAVLKLAQDKLSGFCFLEGYYKLNRFDKRIGTITPILKEKELPLRALKNDENGKLYVLSFRSVVYEVKDSTLHEFFDLKSQGEFDFLPVNKDSLFTIKGGKLYMSFTGNKKVERLLSEAPAYAIHRQGSEIWLFDDPGIRKYENGRARFPASYPSEMKNSRIRCLLKDREGVQWVGTDGNGFFKIPGVPVVNFNSLSEENLLIYNVEEDHEGQIYATSFNEGLFVLKNDQLVRQISPTSEIDFEYFRNVAFDTENNPHILFRRKGEFLLGGDGKLRKVDYPSGWPEKTRAVTLKITGQGHKIYDTTTGLFVSSKDSSYFLNTSGIVTSSTEISSHFYAAFTPDSLFFFKKGKRISFKNAQLTKEHYVIQSLFDTKENRLFWADPETGLYLYDFDTGSRINFNTKSGLNSQLIYNLIIDKRGFIWIGTERGVERLRFSGDNKLVDSRYFGKYEGFTGMETNSGSMVADKNNNIWFGSIYGFYKLVDSLDIEPEVIYQPILDSKRFVFDTLSTKAFETSIHSIDLPWKLNHLSLTFRVVSQKFPDRAFLFYRFKGEETQWNPLPDDGILLLSNLEAGIHVLQVKNALDKNESHLFSYEIRVRPPFWRTWWFISLTSLTLIYTAYRWLRYISNRKIKRAIELREIRETTENEIRKQLGQDFHDEVGNRLASISTQTGVLKLKMRDSGEDEKKILTQIQQNARKLYSDTKDFIWTINPESNRFSEIVMYIKDMGEKVFEYSEMEFRCDSEITAGMNELVLPSGHSMQLIMIFKEAMTNVLKHAGAGKVVFSFEMNGKNWGIALQDKGKGFENGEFDNGHFGLKNMRFRAEKIKATLAMKSATGEGTIIKLSKTYE